MSVSKIDQLNDKLDCAIKDTLYWKKQYTLLNVVVMQGNKEITELTKELEDTKILVRADEVLDAQLVSEEYY